MIIVDDFLLLRVLSSVDDVDGLPDDTLGLTYLRHWGQVSTISLGDGAGWLSRLLARLDPSRRRFIEQPDERLVQITGLTALVSSAARALARRRYRRTLTPAGPCHWPAGSSGQQRTPWADAGFGM